MKQGDPWRSTASAGLPLDAQIPKVNAEEVGEKRGVLRFKAAVLRRHKVEAEKPEGTASVKMRNKVTKQDAQLQENRREDRGIFLKYCHGPKEGRQGLKVGKIIKSQ